MPEETITTQEAPETITTQEPAPVEAQTTEPVTTQQEPAPIETQTQEPVTTQEPSPPEETTAESEQPPAERVVPPSDGYVLPEGISPELGKFANENDFTQEQLDATLTVFNEVQQGQETSRLLALRKMGEAHLKNWGNESDYRLNLAKRALKQNDPDGKLAEALETSGYGNHPAVLDFLYSLGESMKEGGYLKSAVHTPPGERSVAQAMYPDHPSKQ